MKKISVYVILTFLFFQSSLIAYNSEPKEFIKELVGDAINKLSDKNLANLKGLLEKKYYQAIQIETVIDPSLIAGLKVKVGDHIIDGSVRSKLDRLSYQLCEDLV